MTDTFTPAPKGPPREPRKRLPLPRPSKPIGRTKPVKKKARPASETKRIYGSKQRVAWVKSRPCLVANGACEGLIENAHTTTGGMGRKADACHVVPLCAGHHRTLHSIGAETFQGIYGVSLAFAAAQTELAWQSQNSADFPASHGEG